MGKVTHGLETKTHPWCYTYLFFLQVYNLSALYCYVDYWNSDIALMKVEDSLLDKDNTAIVTLPRSPETDTINWPSAGTQCICKGWGCTSEGM